MSSMPDVTNQASVTSNGTLGDLDRLSLQKQVNILD